MPDPADNEDGECFFCADAWKAIAQRHHLSDREMEVLQCLLLGENEKQAAETLGLATSTVHGHLQGAHRKLGAHDRTALIVHLFGAYQDWINTVGRPPGCRMNRRLA